MFRYPAARAFAAWLTRFVLPSDLRVSGAHGVHCSSQVCSRMRVMHHLWRIGPTCRFSFSVRPINFRRADFTAHSCRKNESKQSSGKSWIQLNVRLLGFTPVCGPSPAPFSRWRNDPAMSFFLSQDCGHVQETCIRTGSTPPGSSASKSRSPDSSRRCFSSAHGFVARHLIRANESLQRVVGLTPCRSWRFRVRQQRLPV